MANLTPRHESIMGSNCTGTDGAVSRTYTLAYTNAITQGFLINLQGSFLQQGYDFVLSNGVITFNVTVFDSFSIILDYFESDGSAIITAGYGYVSPTDIYRISGLTASQRSSSDISNDILEAETDICRYTRTIYWKIEQDCKAVSSATINTLTKTGAGWADNALAGLYVWIYSGTGANEARKIDSNTSDIITITNDWAVTPDNTSKFKIFYVPEDFDPQVIDQYDGNNMKYMFVPYYPLQFVESLTIANVSVTPSNIYIYKDGKIQLKDGAEYALFDRTYPQQVDINYWYGVDNLPHDVKRLVELQASIYALSSYITTTAEKASNVSFPELSITNPQAYQVAKTTLDLLQKEFDIKKDRVKIYPVFG